MTPSLRCAAAALFAAAALSVLPAAASEALPVVLKKAEQLLRDGHPRQALALLSPLEEQAAGNPHFDYLLGAAQLVSGHPNQASLALERAVAVEPRHAAARVDLARAYYLLGDLQRAKAEFEVAAQLKPPPAARKTIDNYLSAIAEKEAERNRQYKFAAYAEAVVGHDSNINNAPSQGQVAIPALDNLVVALTPANVQISDNFFGAAAGAGIEVPLVEGFNWIASANLNRRNNLGKSGFDTAAADARTGIEFTRDSHALQLSVLGGRMFLDNRLNRTIAGGSGEWKMAINPQMQTHLALQYLRYRFPAPELAANSFNQWSGVLGMSRLILDDKAAISVNLLWGRERDTRGRADGPKDISGLQLSGRWLWNDDTDFYLNLGWAEGRYDGINPAFRRKRHDEDIRASVGMARKLGEHFSLRPEVNYLRNRSNLPVFDFRELAFSVKARYEFER